MVKINCEEPSDICTSQFIFRSTCYIMLHIVLIYLTYFCHFLEYHYDIFKGSGNYEDG